MGLGCRQFLLTVPGISPVSTGFTTTDNPAMCQLVSSCQQCSTSDLSTEW